MKMICKLNKMRCVGGAVATLWLTIAGCAPASVSSNLTDTETVSGDIDVSIGDVSTDGAYVVARVAAPELALYVSSAGGKPVLKGSVETGPYGIARTRISGLRPGTDYRLHLVAGNRRVVARLRTAPPEGEHRPVRFLFGGDVNGQNVCRDRQRGLPVFEAMRDTDADIFVALGDMIYADGRCERVGALGNEQLAGPLDTLGDQDSFARRWAYTFDDPSFRALRRDMAYIPTWDDHEVVNDFGPGSASLPANPGVDLLPAGLAAFHAFNPIEPAANEPGRIYRSLRWGGLAEFFVLDTRQYRSLNAAPDLPDAPKTMLGEAQRRWLIDELARSDATWKFVATSVPLSIPTGWPPDGPRDGWASGDGATGFELELQTILDGLEAAGVCNVVWLSADVHFATGFRLDARPGASFHPMHEFISGPLSAGTYPSETTDPDLLPQRTYYHAPRNPPATLDEALRWFNFGLVDVAADGALTLQIRNALGETVGGTSLKPALCTGAMQHKPAGREKRGR